MWGTSLVTVPIIGCANPGSLAFADGLTDRCINLVKNWENFVKEFGLDKGEVHSIGEMIDERIAPNKESLKARKEYYSNSSIMEKARERDFDSYTDHCPYLEYCPGRYAEEIVFCSEITQIKCLYDELQPFVSSFLNYTTSNKFSLLSKEKIAAFCSKSKEIHQETVTLLCDLSKRWNLDGKGSLKGFITSYYKAEGMTADFEKELEKSDRNSDYVKNQLNNRQCVDFIANTLRTYFVTPGLEKMDKLLSEMGRKLSEISNKVKSEAQNLEISEVLNNQLMSTCLDQQSNI